MFWPLNPQEIISFLMTHLWRMEKVKVLSEWLLELSLLQLLRVLRRKAERLWHLREAREGLQ